MAKRKWRIVLWIVLGIFILLAVLVALLPAIASTGPVRRAVLTQVAKSANAKIAIKDWSFGWFSGVKIEGIEFADNKGAIAAKVDRVSAPVGIFDLLGSRKNLGHIEVVNPQVTMTLAKASGEQPKPAKKPAAKKEGAAKTPAGQKPLPIDLSLKFDLINGNIAVKSEAAPVSLGLNNLNVSLAITSLNEPMAFSLGTDLTGGGGISATGTAKIFTAGIMDLDKIAVDGALKVDRFPVGTAITLARAFSSAVPEAGGLLDVGINFKMQGTNQLAADGLVALDNFFMTGGPLGADKLALARTTFDFSAGIAGGRLVLNKCALDSPIASLRAGGSMTLAEFPEGSININSSVLLYELARQLPNTLKLQKNQVLSGGVFALDCKLDTAKNGLKADLAMEIKDVAGTLNGRNIGLDKPVKIALKASADPLLPPKGQPFSPACVSLDSMTVSASFIEAAASGNMDAATASVSLDFAAALAEARKFTDLGDLDVVGKLGVSVEMASPDKKRRAIKGNMRIENLAVSGKGLKQLRQQLVESQFGTVVLLDENAPFKPSSLTATTMKLATSFLKASVECNNIALPAEGGQLPTADAKISASVALADLHSVLVDALPSLPAMKLSGSTRFDCATSTKDSSVDVSSIALSIDNLAFEQQGKRLAEKRIEFTCSAEADMKARSAKLKNAKLAFSPGSLTVTSAAVQDWSALPGGATAHAEGNIDLGALLAMLKDFVPLQPGTSVSGKNVLALDIATRADEEDITFGTEITDLVFRAPNVPEIKEDSIKIAAKTTIAPARADVTLESFTVSSSLLALNASGSLKDWVKGRNLDAAGEMTPDFNRITEIIKSLTGKDDIRLTGKKASRFTVKTSLAGADWKKILRDTTMDASFGMEGLEAFGLKIVGISVPANASNGLMTVRVDAAVNQGKISAAPAINVNGPVPMLTLPDNSRLIAGVDLDSAIANQLLGKIHPFFSGCAVTGGKLTFEMKKMKVPLDAGAITNAQFEGRVSIESMSLGSAGMLDMVLQACGVNMRNIMPGNQDFGFVCKNGRIYPDPIAIKMQGEKIVFHGSVGLDQTLDYYVDLPIALLPESVLGKDGKELLKGESARIPISGTASAPKLPKDVAQKIIGDLVKRAGTKIIEKQATKEAGKLIEGLFR